jgi:hypothetical protein
MHFDHADFFHQAFGFAVLPELQVRLLHEIVGVRVHRVDAVQVVPGSVVLAEDLLRRSRRLLTEADALGERARMLKAGETGILHAGAR